MKRNEILNELHDRMHYLSKVEEWAENCPLEGRRDADAITSVIGTCLEPVNQRIIELTNALADLGKPGGPEGERYEGGFFESVMGALNEGEYGDEEPWKFWFDLSLQALADDTF